jgi:tripartite-type tricarboxylate transporter receptor subunit TctC
MCPIRAPRPRRSTLIAGNVQVMFAGLAPVVPQVKAGKVRALAVAGAKRSVALPEVPSLSETLKGYDGSTWFAVFAPAGTPNDIVEKLSADLREDHDAQRRHRPAAAARLRAVGHGAERARPHTRKSRLRNGRKVIKAAGIKGE